MVLKKRSSDQEPKSPGKVRDRVKGMRQRGIYLLPNLFTTCSLFFGFYSIISSVEESYELAVMTLFVAMIFDCLDGRVARLINAQSAFGAQYDSLSDLVSFGIAPGLLVYQWSLHALTEIGLSRLDWLCAFLYVACVALRLAKFNLQTEEGSLSKNYFFGLPCPAAAAMIGSVVWVSELFSLEGLWLSYVMASLTVLLSCLMVSSIPYRSFKNINLRGKIGFTKMFSIVLVMIIISLRPPQALLLVITTYVASGPYQRIKKWCMKRSKLPPPAPRL
jgi:CDP-diacylglycerol--serine O-phosphatidyltransferase